MLKVSVVTATYNSGKTLRDTMESVLRQSYPNIEHIVVDGRSTDDTMAIVREFEPRYGGRLLYVSEPDRGLYDAMNKGVAMAKGDIVGILNSDDFFSSDDVVSRLVERFGDDYPDAIYGDVHFVDESDLSRCRRYYSSKSFRRWKMRMGMMPAHPSFYCRKEIYEKFGNFDISYKIGADFDILLRFIFKHRITTEYIPMDFVTMRMGGVSSSGMQSHRQISRDIMTSLRKAGVRSHPLLVSLRYLMKARQMLYKH